jgi:hypothetical protein
MSGPVYPYKPCNGVRYGFRWVEKKSGPPYLLGEEMRVWSRCALKYTSFVKEAPKDPITWKLLARYMANFKPNTRAMFNRFPDEVWHLRSGIRYSKRGQNYYRITLLSKGDYDFFMRGGLWIFNQNASLVKNLDEAAQPSETVLDSVLIWEAMEMDVPSEEQDENEFLWVRVNLPKDRRLQTQIFRKTGGGEGV